MKKFIYLCLAVVTLTSCSIDSNDGDYANLEYEIAEITSNDLPESFEFGKRYTINLDYMLNTGCSVYDGLYANYENDTPVGRRKIFVSAYSRVVQSGCDETTNGAEGSDSFTITISEPDSYTFYFLTGENSQGEPIYNEVVVPIAEADNAG